MTPHRRLPHRGRLGRRAFLQLAGMGGGAALLAACGQPATPAGAPTQAGGAATTAPAGRVPITFWTPGGSDVFCQGFDTIAQNFMAVEPGISVEKVQCGVSEQESFDERLLALIAAGTPPDSTIVWTSPVAYAARNALVELDDLMAGSKYSQRQNWPEGVLASCIWNDKVYGLPATAGTYAIYYNAEMFAAKGIPTGREDFPKTWDELKRLSAEFVQWDGDTLETAGFMPWTDQVELAVWSALNGTQLYDTENRRFTINSEQNIEMMQYALDFLEEQYHGDWVSVQASGNWAAYADANGRPPMFQENKLAMVVNGFWLNGDMYASEFKGWENWDVAQFPVGPSGSATASGYWPNWLVIPKGSKHVEEAFKYLDYMTVEGIKVWFDNIPDLPANELVPPLVPRITIEKRGEAFANEVAAFFRGQLDVATPMWNSPVQDFANDQIGQAADRIINKVAAPRDALTEAQNACQAELEKVLSGAA